MIKKTSRKLKAERLRRTTTTWPKFNASLWEPSRYWNMICSKLSKVNCRDATYRRECCFPHKKLRSEHGLHTKDSEHVFHQKGRPRESFHHGSLWIIMTWLMYTRNSWRSRACFFFLLREIEGKQGWDRRAQVETLGWKRSVSSQNIDMLHMNASWLRHVRSHSVCLIVKFKLSCKR